MALFEISTQYNSLKIIWTIVYTQIKDSIWVHNPTLTGNCYWYAGCIFLLQTLCELHVNLLHYPSHLPAGDQKMSKLEVIGSSPNTTRFLLLVLGFIITRRMYARKGA